ncbi:MAG: signal peptide peptidase SppA, partial [Candidatus Caenarcaniphilales bacterium]|nr:signal peptide peptidase SppA [Candidatus Caenarcaniphilales bacterium]
ASMGDVAASGGYYVASATDIIFANSGTLTGSIGVISHFSNFEGLMGKVGVKDMTIKSGRYKDIGSSSRTMTPEEQEILQALVDDTYDQFIKDVYEGRRTKDATYGEFRKSLTRDDIRELAEGMIYTGKQAKEVGLVDRIGSYYDALEELQRMVKKRSKGKIKQNLPVSESVGSKSLKDIIGFSTSNGAANFSVANFSVESIAKLIFTSIKGEDHPLLQSKTNIKTYNFMPPIMLLAPEFMNSF